MRYLLLICVVLSMFTAGCTYRVKDGDSGEWRDISREEYESLEGSE